MSAIIAIRGPDVIHILTDAALTDVNDGRLVRIQPKQVLTARGIVVAGVGPWSPCPRFAKLAEARTKNIDEVTDAVVDLWTEARKGLPPWAESVPYATVIAGWSDALERLTLVVIRSAPDDPAAFDVFDTTGFVGVPVPTEECEVMMPFLERLEESGNASFDPHRDGLELMEILRREYPKPFELCRRPAVGGFAQLTTIRRGHITTEVIHHWPDVSGRYIELDAEPPITNAAGLPWGQHLVLREAIVCDEWRAEDADKSPGALAERRMAPFVEKLLESPTNWWG